MDYRIAELKEIDKNTYAVEPVITGEAKKIVEQHDKSKKTSPIGKIQEALAHTGSIITADDKPVINFAPDTVVEEVLQNVRTILTTIKHSIPLDRSFGIDGEVIDLPINVAKAKMTNEIFRAVRQYEPRAVIESITFTGEDKGILRPKMEVRINETS
jgi:phage baseplate assembly protein W